MDSLEVDGAGVTIQACDGMFRKGWGEKDTLSPDEVPHDPALPQLGTMLDATAMNEILQHALPIVHATGSRDATCCRIANVRYRPGLKCTASYRLDTTDESVTSGGIRFVTVSNVSARRAERRLPEITGAARRDHVRFEYLPERHMVLSSFPHDLRVRRLHELVNRDALRCALHTAVDSSKTRLRGLSEGGVRATVVSYRPERSCLIRCELQQKERDDGEHWHIYARVYADGRGEQVFRAMQLLWDCDARRSGQISFAEPLGYDTTTGTLFQGAVNGALLRDLANEDTFLDHVGSVAHSLAVMHKSSLPISRTRDPHGDLDWLVRMGRGLAAVRPVAGERIGALLARLRRTAPEPSAASRGVVHGDFSLNQILVDGPRTSIIDFDDVGIGDTYADLGTFLARLEGRLPGGVPEGDAADVFGRDYQEASGVPLQRDRVHWYQALANIRLGLSALSQLKPGWPQRLDFNLQKAENLLL